MKSKLSTIGSVNKPAGWSDSLDGRELCEGERLELEWPDGTRTKRTIHVDVEDTENREAYGFTWTTSAYHAYVACLVHGAKVRVYVHGFKARRLDDSRGMGDVAVRNERQGDRTKKTTYTDCYDHMRRTSGG